VPKDKPHEGRQLRLLCHKSIHPSFIRTAPCRTPRRFLSNPLLTFPKTLRSEPLSPFPFSPMISTSLFPFPRLVHFPWTPQFFFRKSVPTLPRMSFLNEDCPLRGRPSPPPVTLTLFSSSLSALLSKIVLGARLVDQVVPPHFWRLLMPATA